MNQGWMSAQEIMAHLDKSRATKEHLKYVRISDEFRFCFDDGYAPNHNTALAATETATSAAKVTLTINGQKISIRVHDHSLTLRMGPVKGDENLIQRLFEGGQHD